MKIKNAVPILTLLFAIGGSTSVMAADPTASVISGTVQNVDTVNNSVQVKDNSGTLQTVKVDNNTQIAVQGKSETLNDLKIGDVVTIKTTKSAPDTM